MSVERLLSTRAQRAFIITIAVQAVIVITMIGSTFGIVHAYLGDTFDLSRYKTLSCYLALFILAELFELFMAYDALRMRNIIQLLGIILFHGALIVFSALQVHETQVALFSCVDQLQQCVDDSAWLYRKVAGFLIVAPCVVAVSWLSLVFWLKQLYGEFGWVIFHVVGASPKLKSMYQFYQIFICLLKFDFFAFVGVTMQLLIVVLTTNSAEFGITIAAIPVILFLIAGCAYAVQREIKWLMSISMAVMLPCMSYCRIVFFCTLSQMTNLSTSLLTAAVVYKLVRFYLPSSEEQYITTRATLTVFTASAFILLLATFLIGLKCFYDFDKGLHDSKTHDINAKQQYSSSSKSPGGMAERQSAYMGGTPLQPQISIE